MTTKWSPNTKCGKHQQDNCCEPDCSSGSRNRYFTGKRLTPDVFRVEQQYLVERRRLINRAVHGWGVVYGYAVALADDGARSGLAVGAGLAFDRMGRELVQTAQTIVSLDDMLEIASEACEGDTYLLRVHYAERLTAETQVSDACNCKRQQWDRVCETVRYSLQKLPPSAGRDPHACELACVCETCAICGGDLAGDHGPDDPRAGAFPCLCRYVTELSPGTECAHLDEVFEGIRVDLHNGVPLAWVILLKNECDDWRISAIADACGPRRLVKRNDLLFDLIRGCDLTRISNISWGEWHRASMVPWEIFNDFFDNRPFGEDKKSCLTTLTIDFSRPVLRSTLTPDCVSMTFLIRQREGGWQLPARAPITGIYHKNVSGDEQEFAQRAVLVVSWGWVKDALRSSENEFERKGTLVEIEIYGDYILDCNNQPVDAEARGNWPFPSGNGSPGGTFRSNFRLAAKPADFDSANTATDQGGTPS